MDEVTRIAAVDKLADRWLARGDERPATEVWDAAAKVIDEAIRRDFAQATGKDIRKNSRYSGTISF
jgi:hypothetical protein